MNRETRGRHPILTALVVIALVVFVILPLVAHLAGFLLLLGGTGGGCYWLGLNRRPVTRARLTAPADDAVSTAAPHRAASKRARRNGWTPPASAPMTTLTISEECATEACAMCPGGGCGCPCGHDPKVIAAINTARAGTDRPPF